LDYTQSNGDGGALRDIAAYHVTAITSRVTTGIYASIRIPVTTIVTDIQLELNAEPISLPVTDLNGIARQRQVRVGEEIAIPFTLMDVDTLGFSRRSLSLRTDNQRHRANKSERRLEPITASHFHVTSTSRHMHHLEAITSQSGSSKLP
jgi:hypothetical protein